jgi:hypothetical protein
MFESLKPVKRAWSSVDVPGLMQVKRAWESVELSGRASPVQPDQPSTVTARPSVRPSTVAVTGPSAEQLPETVSHGAKPSSVPAQAITPGQLGSLPVPLSALAQVEPWGHPLDYDFMSDPTRMNPGLQDIYKQLRTGRRPETGFWPIRPEIAFSMLQPAAENALFQEGVDRAVSHYPQWVRLVKDRLHHQRVDEYIKDRAYHLAFEER